MRASREEWEKRVERWRESGLSAEQYASELGINAGRLKFWKYQLGRPAAKASPVRSLREALSKELPLVEVRAAVTTPSAPKFELELRGGGASGFPSRSRTQR